MEFIAAIEDALGMKAQMNMLPMQLGDVPATYADIEDLVADVGYRPDTPVKLGVYNFVKWYKEYYQI